MKILRLSIILAAILCSMAFAPEAFAQFRSEAFSQDYSNDPDADGEDVIRDSSFTLSFSEFFKGVAGKGTSRMGNTFFASTVVIGGQQMYNKDYWKLPIIYGGIGAGIGMGFKYRKEENTKMQNIMFASAGAVYWAALMDGLLNYETTEEHSATKAALLSLLVPGLGQCYNGDYWKVPIYWGFMLGSYHFLNENSVKYNKYKQMYIDANNGLETKLPAETAKYYKDIYREWRDYSILAIAASYLLQVIDANVFAYMLDFQVSEDIALDIKPTVFTPDTQFAFNPGGFGLKVGITF